MEYEWDKNEENGSSVYHANLQGEAKQDANPDINNQNTEGYAPQQPQQQNQYHYNQPNQQPRQPEKPGRKGLGTGKKILIALACAAVFGIVAGGTFFGVKALSGAFRSIEDKIITEKPGSSAENVPDDTPTQPASDTPGRDNIPRVKTDDYQSASGNSLDVSDLVEATMPSLVSITNISVQEVQNYFGMWGFGGNNGSQQKEIASRGSGVIVDKNDTEILIVTNEHVVQGASTLTVSFIDNEAYSASVKGYDSNIDIALISVKISDMSDGTLSAVKLASFGDSTALKVGQQVVAIGNALGYGQSVTTGIVSALDRTLSTSSASLIQTDAAINPGNSGGALFNMRGEVIGINSSKYVDSTIEGMGFAIPSATVAPLVEDFECRAVREKVPAEQASYLGIKGQDLGATAAASYGLPQGIYLTYVEENGPAAKAGMETYSIIIKFDRQTIKTMSELKELLLYYAAGEQVKITAMVNDGGTYVEKEYDVTLGHADNGSTAPSSKGIEDSVIPYFGGESGDGRQGGNNGGSLYDNIWDWFFN